VSATAEPAPAPVDQPAPEPGRTPLRLVVVPTPQPPLDDPRIPVRLVLPGAPSPRPPHRPGPRPRETGRAPLPDRDFGPALSGRADLPDPHQSGRRLLTVALEALAGRRPLAQVQPLTSPGVYTALASRGRPRWCAEGTAPLVLGRVHVCEPVDGVAEITAVAHRSGRAHAIAARLEGIDGRWRCTALQIG
jgi:Family of unknown function (DUF6459)